MTTIKKYPNRRLYHTGERRYVNLEDVERMVREDADFRVVDAQSGDDITRRVLAQVILEQMQEYEPVLPAELLRFVIKQRGMTTGWQDLVRRFAGNVPFAGAAAPWADVLASFMGGAARPASAPPPPPDEPDEPPEELRDELDTLKERLAEIEKKLGRRK
ncbi:MAG: polyhydroxyalkanoate synthesis regulator DNA-binding domain-containing protein [Deltaproteobacteria bacterium]|nr:polyhydroxyalkanoate synthesis regulator DNA-binding domain-containing protein [Deltaproteobacteria bacterium]